MDSFASGGVGASIVVVIGLIYSAVNHKRIRSTCCGRQVDASLDIENTTPTKIKIRDPTTLMVGSAEPALTPKAKEETKSPA
jgi:hypothetical protein